LVTLKYQHSITGTCISFARIAPSSGRRICKSNGCHNQNC